MENSLKFTPPTAESLALQARVGRALGLATRFEENCKSIQYFDLGRDNASQSYATEDEKMVAMMDSFKKLGKSTLKAHSVEILKRYGPVFPSSIDDPLDAGVKSRNYVAHELAHDVCAGLLIDDPKWCALTQALLVHHLRNIALADLIVALIFSTQFPDATMPTEGDVATYVERAVRWVITGSE